MAPDFLGGCGGRWWLDINGQVNGAEMDVMRVGELDIYRTTL